MFLILCILQRRSHNGMGNVDTSIMMRSLSFCLFSRDSSVAKTIWNCIRGHIHTGPMHYGPPALLVSNLLFECFRENVCHQLQTWPDKMSLYTPIHFIFSSAAVRLFNQALNNIPAGASLHSKCFRELIHLH